MAARDLKLTAVLVDKVSAGLKQAAGDWKRVVEEAGRAQSKTAKTESEKLAIEHAKRERDLIAFQRRSVALEDRMAKERASISMRAGENAERASKSQSDAALRIERQASIAQSSLIVNRFDRRIAIERTRHAQILSDLRGNNTAQEAEIRRHAAVVSRIQMDKANLPNTPFQRLLGHLGGQGQAGNTAAGVGVALKGAGTELLAMAGPLAAGVLGFAALSRGMNSAIESANRMNTVRRSLEFAAGGAKAGAVEFAFLSAEAKRLGFDLQSSAQGFAMLSAAARGTALEGKGARDIFSSVSEAAITMGLSSDQTSGALLAIQQMISKGTVQSEELRGQLGERLPGAFQIAARAMGVTTAKLGDMLKAGEVMSDEFLPKFAAELHKTFGTSATKAADEGRAAIKRFKNELSQTGAVIGEVAVGGLGMLAESYLAVSDAISKAADNQNRLYSTPLLSGAQVKAQKANNEAMAEGLRMAEAAKAQERQKTAGPTSAQQAQIEIETKEAEKIKEVRAKAAKDQVEARAKEMEEAAAFEDRAAINNAAREKAYQDAKTKFEDDANAAFLEGLFAKEAAEKESGERRKVADAQLYAAKAGYYADYANSVSQMAGVLGGKSKAAFAIQKAIALGEIAIRTAAAVVQSNSNPLTMWKVPYDIALGASQAAVVSATALKGFERGGYTGDGGRSDVAGVVHAGEMVWSQDDVKRVGGPKAADNIRQGGGMTHSGTVNINIAMPAGTTPSQAREAGRAAAVGYQEEMKRHARLSADVKYYGVTA